MPPEKSNKLSLNKAMKKLLFLFSIYIIASSFVIFFPSITSAQALLENGSNVPFSDKACMDSGDCKLSDFTVLMVRVSQIILGLTGSLSLLAFVYGGTLFLISSGNKEMVEKGKNTIIGAVIGIFIVFMSYTLIGYIFTSIGIPGAEKWYSSDWFKNK
jgi:hypothetical protein